MMQKFWFCCEVCWSGLISASQTERCTASQRQTQCFQMFSQLKDTHALMMSLPVRFWRDVNAALTERLMPISSCFSSFSLFYATLFSDWVLVTQLQKHGITAVNGPQCAQNPTACLLIHVWSVEWLLMLVLSLLWEWKRFKCSSGLNWIWSLKNEL